MGNTPSGLSFPNGARFAFTVHDDTDDATVKNVRPLYRLLSTLGIGATKTVWPFRHDGPSNFFACETLEDKEYLDFIHELRDDGFELSWHGASYESSCRDRTLDALRRFFELFGTKRRIHANHAMNREKLYRGPDRVDIPILRWFFQKAARLPRDHYQGHVIRSSYWWGDACREHIVYARNLTFSRLNLASINPTLPYIDSRRPLAPYWFSASDAESVEEFNRLTASFNLERLEQEGGFTIVATHFGKGFVRDGKVNAETRRNLEELAARNGWFPTTGELLDWLLTQRPASSLSRFEWTRMQHQWATDLLQRKTLRRMASQIHLSIARM